MDTLNEFDERRLDAFESRLISTSEEILPRVKTWRFCLEVVVELDELSETSLRGACRCVDQYRGSQSERNYVYRGSVSVKRFAEVAPKSMRRSLVM